MQHSSEDSIRNRNCSISKGRALSTPDVYASPLHHHLGNGWWIIMLSVHAQRQPRNATSTRSLKLPMPEAKNCAHSQLPFILLLWGGPSIPSAE
ncbi:hypothetical protein BDQ94DRAFT_163684 [Aspergillus welwitschiae]|uniref:Uncharacterized protein n=1 Tax=Aspergillus welwitschiae TaxID=1341132 RepID=A0A3F3PLX8_9EURO|nr:hypothetical protein BDQ94DRAFT_163684 [Aspergillus welwitschiae]RDH27366.1 hypothetical protein BDQ94DRAFT_163684 [Aspergillus welwitschiae]